MRCPYWLVVGVWLAWAGTGASVLEKPARGDPSPQDRRRDPRRDSGVTSPLQDMFDPQKMMDQWFGAETPEQQRAWEQVSISRDEEAKFGSQAAEQFREELRGKSVRVLTRGREVEYVRSLVDEVHGRMRNADRYPTITVWVVDSAETDARCFPGGTLVIFRGLLDAARSEAALVGVIGHELSHIDRGHQLKYLKAMKLAQSTFQGESGRMDFRTMMNNAQLMTRTFARPFRPDEETQADFDGATWAYEAGYDPRELAQLFLRLHQRDGQPAFGPPPFLRTHPFHLDRYDAILERYTELAASAPRESLYVGRRNLRELIPRRKRAFDER